MKRIALILAVASAAMLSAMSASADESKFTIGREKSQSHNHHQGGRGYSKPEVDKNGNEVKDQSSNGYKFGYTKSHGGPKETYLGGNTKKGDTKGGGWITREHGGEWSWGVEGEKEKGKNHGKFGGKIGGGYSDSIGGGMQTGRAGNDRWGIQGRMEGRLKAEVKAALEAALKNDDKFAGLVVEASAEGTVSGELSGSTVITLGGVPVTVTGTVEGHWGISAHAGVRLGYNKTKGSWVFEEGCGFSLGFGASEKVTVEVDAEKFCKAVGLEKEWNAFQEKLNGKAGSRHEAGGVYGNHDDSAVTTDDLDGLGDGDSNGTGRKGSGAKGIKGHKWGGG